MDEKKVSPVMEAVLKEMECLADSQYECLQWENIGKASVAVANILYMGQFEEWHKEGLEICQLIIKDYCSHLQRMIEANSKGGAL